MGKSVLVCGAGVAGATLAYWLAHHGFAVTVVERADGQRSSGSPVDVKGPAVAVAQEMGIMPRLRAAASGVSQMTFVNSAGRAVARMGLAMFQGGAGDLEVEIPRADLAAILLDTARGSAEFRWGDTITGLDDDGTGVEVTFGGAPSRRFDLVVGADGLHSVTRRLAFGPEQDFIRYTGMYVATLAIGKPFGTDREVVIYNAPGRAVSVHPTRGHAVAAFIFRHPAVAGFDHRDTAQHKRVVTEAFVGTGWRVPELLDLVQATDDLYFDSVSQVRLPRWSKGRVALVGDAASCLSLFGDGSTLAMAGARTLARELAASPADPQHAFGRYETVHRAMVAPKLNGYRMGAALLLPSTRAGILARNTAAHTVQAAFALRRKQAR